jgi:hypothetical protein
LYIVVTDLRFVEQSLNTMEGVETVERTVWGIAVTELRFVERGLNTDYTVD